MTGTISGADLALPVIKLQTRGAAAERASRETPDLPPGGKNERSRDFLPSDREELSPVLAAVFLNAVRCNF